MLRYIGQRLARSLLSLVIIITVVFCLLRMMPIEGYFQNIDRLSAIQIHNGLEKLGLNDPLHIQLINFFKQLLKGDLGASTRYRVNYPIIKIFAQKAPISLKFGFIADAIAIPLGLCLGVVMARRKSGLWDKFGTVFIVLMQALPAAVYYLFIQMFGVDMFRVSFLYDPDKVSSMILPILSLTLPGIAYFATWMRRYTVDETNKDYIKLARTKGVPNLAIWFRHVFRNAIVPIAQLVPTYMIFSIAGSIYVESLYSIPGMGGLLVDVIKRQDNTMVQALVIIFAILSIVSLLLGDLLMALVDPRINLTKKEASR